MTSILEKTKMVSVACSVVIEKDGKYLMVKEAKEAVAGLWNFPAGKVEFGEELIAAAQREALEESGYECEITDFMSVYYFYWNDRPGLTVRFNFWGKVKNNKQNSLASDILESKWLTISEIEELKEKDLFRTKSTHRQFSELKEGKRLLLSTVQTP